jgi:hypothetical protein
MQQRFSRRKLGPKFSEAARQLWIALEERGWGQNEAMRQLELPSGQISKLLYGERKAGRVWSGRFKDQLGIEERLWDEPPVIPFIPPAARKTAARKAPARRKRSAEPKIAKIAKAHDGPAPAAPRKKAA